MVGRWPNGPCFDAYVEGNLAFISNGGGMDILDISDPQIPKRIGRFITNDLVYGIYVIDNYAYVANRYSGLRIIDISDPSSPQQVGLFETGGFVVKVFVKDSYAYVVDFNNGLYIVDVSNKSSPQELGHFSTGYYWDNVYVQGNTAYLAADELGLYILDISNPASPTLLGKFAKTNGWDNLIVFDLYVVGSIAYLGCYFTSDTKGLYLIDVSNPAQPQELSQYYIQRSYAYDVYVKGDIAYVASGYLEIIDVSDPFLRKSLDISLLKALLKLSLWMRTLLMLLLISMVFIS